MKVSPSSGWMACALHSPAWSTTSSFLGIAVLVIVTPGQDTALTIRNARGGPVDGSCHRGGVTCGQAVWTVATAAGVAALLAASEPVFTAVKLAGAAYSCSSACRR